MRWRRSTAAIMRVISGGLRPPYVPMCPLTVCLPRAQLIGADPGQAGRRASRELSILQPDEAPEGSSGALVSPPGCRGAGMGVGCAMVLAGSLARRSAVWGRPRDGPTSRRPGRRQTSLGAIEAFSSSCARWCAAHPRNPACCSSCAASLVCTRQRTPCADVHPRQGLRSRCTSRTPCCWRGL